MRLKGPYNNEVTEFLESQIITGLKKLKVFKKLGINYEEFCSEIVNNLPDSIYAPEWVQYWEGWRLAFHNEFDQRKRNTIFKRCITDVIKKGLLRSEVPGLSGNITDRVRRMLEKEGKTPTQK